MDQKNPEKQPEKEEQRNQKAPQPGSAGKKETGTSVAALFQDTGFWIRVINVIVIVVAILYYNQITGYHQQLVKAQKTIKSLSARLETAQSRAAGSADNAASGQDTGDASASGQTSDGK